jgi:hypothetical protein
LDDESASVSFSLLGASFWSSYWMVEARGGVVCIFCIDDVGLGGMAQRSLGDGRALMDSRRAASSVWRHGGVDGSSDEGLYFGLSPGKNLLLLGFFIIDNYIFYVHYI